MMQLAGYLPFWDQLSPAQQDALGGAAQFRRAAAGTLLHQASDDCLGLVILTSGQLRAYLASPQGREITLYRLLERDICLFSASCTIPGLSDGVNVSVERDAAFWLIPPAVYQALVRGSAAAAGYMNEIMASRLSDMMWLVDQLLNQKMDARVAAFLLEESALAGSDALSITHESIAKHLGTAREVVTRVLHYLKSEGLIALSRGGTATITILNRAGLMRL